MNKEETLENQVLRLERRLAALEKVDAQTPTVPGTGVATRSQLGAVYNRLRNGDISLSENHYNDAPPPSGLDDEKEAAHFYTHAAGTTLLVENSAHALSSTGHAVNNPAGAADPQWDRVNGALQWGSDRSIDCPLPSLPHRVGEPSKLVYVGFIARLASSSIVIPAGLKVALGLHDNTVGQEKYLEGGPFAVTASVVGTPAATTSRKYKIVAETNWGETYESNEFTLATAPSNASYITNSVYVRVDWDKVEGATIYRIYRLTGATYVLAGEIFNGVTGFNEQNNFLKVEAGYPVTSGSNARALVEIDFDDLTTDWGRYEINIPVPSTYNSSLTTDKQWLRMTLSQALAAGSEQGIEIDKIYASWNYGNFAPAPEDAFAKQSADTSASSGSQGGAGTSGGGDPPNPGGGGRCVWVEEMVTVIGEDGYQLDIPAREVTLQHRILSFLKVDGGLLPVAQEIDQILEGTTSLLFVLLTGNGHFINCSPDHPVITGVNDDRGVAAALLRNGASILTLPRGSITPEASTLKAWTTIEGPFRVRIFVLRNTHLFVAGRVISHNIKLEESNL